MTFPAPAAPQWFESHENLATLAYYLAEQGSTAHEVADAIEKPWKYEAEYNEALAAEAAGE